MNLNDFVSYYDLLDLEIISIHFKDANIEMRIRLNVDMDYIANGYRPEFNYEVIHLFIFEKQKEDIQWDGKTTIKDYHLDEKGLNLLLSNHMSLFLYPCNIKVINHK